jgi:hypothetical protein
VLIVVVAAVTGNKNKPAAAPSATTSPTPVAQSYTSVQSLLAAMAAHGATCSNPDIKTGSTVAGALSTFAECSGVSSGDTAVVMFTDPASALAYANGILSLNQSASLGPTAVVIGPDWAVNTAPAFATKVTKAVGGQLISASSAVPAASAPAASAPAASAPAASAPAASAPAASAPATPSMTAAQAQAVQAAQSYLALGSGFSYESLLKQLTSSYGDGFSVADATFAINYLKPDWDQQAVEAAKGYLALGTGFSRDSLIQQLTSSYGDGFTQSQADYAVAKVGL